MLDYLLPCRRLIGAMHAAEFASDGQDVQCHHAHDRNHEDAVRMARTGQAPAVLVKDDVAGPVRFLFAPPVPARDGERVAGSELG